MSVGDAHSEYNTAWVLLGFMSERGEVYNAVCSLCLSFNW